jgi:osmotically-inducible protein OsmY
MRQLEWDPEVDASAIGVAAKQGTITLTGFIDTYAGKLAAERSAKRVHGVRVVANDLEVRLRLERTDPDIASDAERALRLHGEVPETVQAVVHHGRVTLTGKVDWLFQSRDAEKAVRHVRGVCHVFNRIEVVSRAIAEDVRHRIEQALHRNADIDAHRVAVTINGTLATLTGDVVSWTQREIAERAASQAQGITAVENLIAVTPPERPESDLDEIC